MIESQHFDEIEKVEMNKKVEQATSSLLNEPEYIFFKFIIFRIFELI